MPRLLVREKEARQRGDIVRLAEIARETIEALQDLEAMLEHEVGCTGNSIDLETCPRCRVNQALGN